jgi:tRNA dimethylallyltransferase
VFANPFHRALYLTGPTAVGKTAVGVALARRLGAEVVALDSMTLYRGMDIGTAKLTPPEREGVPHHLLDVWDVGFPAAVAEYQGLARAAIDGILARGRVPLLVGGSGLYVRAVLEEFEFPGTDPGIRARLEEELASVGSGLLHERLRSRDPEAAAKILPSNGRRIVRALEVIELTGRPFTAALPQPTPYYESVQIGVDREVAALDSRIERRVEIMWAAGLVDEVRALPAIRDGRTASRALGYQQAIAQLDGEMTEAEAIASTIQGTRRFVRRQRSWFRRDPAIVWLDGASDTLVADALTATR